MDRTRQLRVGICLAIAMLAAACGGSDKTEEVTPNASADSVRDCLSARGRSPAELPLSDVGGTALAIDFGQNSVQIYVERSAADVETERRSIRAAEDQVGNTGSSRVILRSDGNVLVSWANEPSDEERALVGACAGVA